MKSIFEIRIHGRAGQGAKTLAQFVAQAAMEKGKFIQAFPSYSADREGAPMEAYVRISTKPILLHCAVLNPDLMIIIDPTLLDLEEVKLGLDSSDIFLANTKLSQKDLQHKLKTKAKVYTLDASGISRGILGKDFPNIVLLGAFSKITNYIQLKDLEKIVYKKFERKLGKEMTEKNIEAMRRGCESI
ncbi:MAG: 2-oxoacid:acceptor oxidoreductase family protein [Patescibacteria group bacterium]